MDVCSFASPARRTSDANEATLYVKLGKKRLEIYKRNYYIISPRVIMKAIIIMSIGTILLLYALCTFHMKEVNCQANAARTPCPGLRFDGSERVYNSSACGCLDGEISINAFRPRIEKSNTAWPRTGGM